HRVRARLRARRRRVRICHLYRRQPAHGLGDHPAHHHHQARAVRLRWGHGRRRRHAGGVFCTAVDHQRAPELERRALGEGARMTATTAAILRDTRSGSARFEANAATRDPLWIKVAVLGISLAFFGLFLLLPLVAVFVEALRRGWAVYLAALAEPDALSAIQLTL